MHRATAGVIGLYDSPRGDVALGDTARGREHSFGLHRDHWSRASLAMLEFHRGSRRRDPAVRFSGRTFRGRASCEPWHPHTAPER